MISESQARLAVSIARYKAETRSPVFIPGGNTHASQWLTEYKFDFEIFERELIELLTNKYT